MPNDAKLGLVAGVAAVVLIAAIFFRRDAAQAEPQLPGPPPPKFWSPQLPPSQLPPSPELPSADDNDNAPLPPPPMLSGDISAGDRE